MKPTDRKYMMLLLDKKQLPLSKLPKRLKNNNHFINLVSNRILCKERSGGGFVVKIEDKEKFKNFIKANFPEELAENSKIGNTRAFRNSKATIVKNKERVIFMRGKSIIKVNGDEIDLNQMTKKFGLFAMVIEHLEVDKLCFVENLPPFMLAEQIIDDSYVFVHGYGRIGKNILSKINAKEILVFSDYDYTGLREYLLIKSYFPTTIFFIPKNYDELFQNFSIHLTAGGKQPRISKVVQNSTEALVCKIREQVKKKQHFLEQEALFNFKSNTK